MRSIRELREMYPGKLYVLCTDQNECRSFLEDAEREGYMLGNTRPTDNHVSDIIAVKDDGRLAYVSTNGRIAIQCDAATLIDYAAYRRGDDNYICAMTDWR